MAPHSEKLHEEHTRYTPVEEQNIVTSQPEEYTDMTGKNLHEIMDAYHLSPAVQHRISEMSRFSTEGFQDLSDGSSTTPYLARSFAQANITDIGNTSEKNTGELIPEGLRSF